MEGLGVVAQSPDNPVAATSVADRVAYIEAFDYRPYVPKEEREPGRIIKELQRFLILIAEGLHHAAMTSPRVDEVWHRLIYMSSRAYFAFCDRAFGYYLHHVSRKFGAELEEARRVRMTEFRIAYEMRFGEAPPADIWFRREDCCNLPGDDPPTRPRD